MVVGKRWRRLASLGWVGLSCALVSGKAGGEVVQQARPDRGGPGAVEIALPRCDRPPYDTVVLRDALALELSRRQRAASGTRALPVAVVRVELSRCEPEADLVWVAADADGEVVLSRRIALLGVPFDARARTLALLIAESLVTAARTHASATPPAAVRATAGVLEPAVSDAAVSDAAVAVADAELDGAETALQTLPLERSSSSDGQTSTQVGLGLQLGSPWGSRARFWGAGLSVDGVLWRGLSWAAEAALMSHVSSTALGELHATWWSGSLGVDLTRRGGWALAVGPRVSLARVSAQGENRFGVGSLAQTEMVALAGARGSVALTLGSAWRVLTWWEMQRVLRGVVFTAGAERAVGIEGWFAAGGVGVGVGFE